VSRFTHALPSEPWAEAASEIAACATMELALHLWKCLRVEG
jgi:hypothetical protein